MLESLKLLQARHSVRSYSPREIPEELRRTLRAEVTMINTLGAGLRFQLGFDDPAPFEGFRRSYGLFRGVRNYLAAVVDPSIPGAMEDAGYHAEMFVLRCVQLGLGTCFVGGTFSERHVSVEKEVYEKIPFLVAFGYPDEKETLAARISRRLAHRRRMQPRDFLLNSDGKPAGEAEFEDALKRFPRLEAILEAVACAPSAMNVRQVRIQLPAGNGAEEELQTVTLEKGEFRDIDLGIAKANIDNI